MTFYMVLWEFVLTYYKTYYKNSRILKEHKTRQKNK